MLNDIQLSPHFTLLEFTKSATARSHGFKNEPAPEHVENLRALCVHTLEPLREELGLPVVAALTLNQVVTLNRAAATRKGNRVA